MLLFRTNGGKAWRCVATVAALGGGNDFSIALTLRWRLWRALRCVAPPWGYVSLVRGCLGVAFRKRCCANRTWQYLKTMLALVANLLNLCLACVVSALNKAPIDIARCICALTWSFVCQTESTHTLQIAHVGATALWMICAKLVSKQCLPCLRAQHCSTLLGIARLMTAWLWRCPATLASSCDSGVALA